MKHAKGLLWLLSGIVAVLVGVAIGADQGGSGAKYVNDRAWDAGGGANVDWSTAANWSGDTEPGANDRATFNRGASTTVNLDANKTVSDVIIGYPQEAFDHTFNNAAATLNVTTSFAFNVYWDRGVFTFNPVLNLSGLFSAMYTHSSYEAQLVSALNFPTAGNTIGGGMDVKCHMITFSGNNNTFNGDILVQGWQDILSAQNNRWSGKVYIEGTGNSFGTGQFVLNAGGLLRIKNSTDLSNITNIQWQGGTLQLGMAGAVPANAWAYPAVTGGFEVKRGILLLNSDTNLGSVAYPLILGGLGGCGTLQGDPSDTVGHRMDRPITLAGNGGMFYPLANGGATHQYIGSLISGPGEFIKVSPWNTYLRNGPYAVVTPNTYAGGTRVVNGILIVDPLRSLGTGNVSVENSAILDLYSTNNIAPGATVTLKSVQVGQNICPSAIRLYADMPIPTVTADSIGMISLDATAVWNDLQTPRGDKIYLACWSSWKTTSCTNIAPSSDGVYHLIGGAGGHHYYNGAANVFYGTNSMEIGIPADLSWWGGIVQFTGGMASNSFTGKITIHTKGSLFFNQRTDNGTQIGSTNSDVELHSQSLLYQYAVASGKPTYKNNLIVKGQGRLAVYDYGTIDRFGEMHFASYTRENYGAIEIGSADPIGDPQLGSRERIFIHSGVPALTNGIVTPYLCGPNAFLTYDAGYGFSNAPYSVVANGANFPSGITAGTDIVNVVSGGTNCVLQDDPYVYALRMTNALSKGAGSRIAIASGGLIINERGTALGIGHVSSADFVFGTVSGSTTNLTEAFIWTDKGTGRWLGPEICGQIHCAGLTKNGAGWLRLSGDNQNTIKGPVVINNGILSISTNGYALGSDTNIVILNGGYFYVDAYGFSSSNLFLIGPNGGIMGDAHSGLNMYGDIADQFPGDAGPLMWAAGYWHMRGSTNTFTGGLLVPGNGVHFWSGVPSMGTGPIRVYGDGGWINNFTPNIWVHPSRVTIQRQNAYLGLNGAGADLGSLDGYGLVRFGETWTWCGKPYLTVGSDNTDFTFYGTIFEQQYQGNRGQVTKVGSGTWTLYGEHTYHGNTYVSNGTLCLNGMLEYSSNVYVSAGATLCGKGYIARPVWVIGNGRIGDSLVLASNVTLNSSSFFDVTINGTTPFSQHTQMTLTGGTLDLASATLNVTLGFAPTVGQQFTILNNQGTCVNQFAQGRVVSAVYNGRTYYFRIDYTAGDGNDIVLTSLPVGTTISVK